MREGNGCENILRTAGIGQQQFQCLVSIARFADGTSLKLDNRVGGDQPVIGLLSATPGMFEEGVGGSRLESIVVAEAFVRDRIGDCETGTESLQDTMPTRRGGAEGERR